MDSFVVAKGQLRLLRACEAAWGNAHLPTHWSWGKASFCQLAAQAQRNPKVENARRNSNLCFVRCRKHKYVLGSFSDPSKNFVCQVRISYVRLLEARSKMEPSNPTAVSSVNAESCECSFARREQALIGALTLRLSLRWTATCCAQQRAPVWLCGYPRREGEPQVPSGLRLPLSAAALRLFA